MRIFRLNKDLFKDKVRKSGYTLVSLSRAMNYTPSYLSQKISRGEVRMSLIYAIEKLTGEDFQDVIVKSWEDNAIAKINDAINKNHNDSFHDRLQDVINIAEGLKKELAEYEQGGSQAD